MNATAPLRKLRFLTRTLLLACYCALALSAFAQPGEVLRNSSIVELKQSGFGDTVLIEKIKNSPCDFDVSLAGLKQLKAADLSDTVLAAMVAARPPAPVAPASGGLAVVEPVTDINDPNSPHDPGIWLYEETGGIRKMTQLEPSVYSQNKSGVAFFMGYGQTVKNRAVIRSAHAQITTAQRQPVFYFYFERTQAGLSDVHGATSPNEFILAEFEVEAEDNERRLVMSSIDAYSGGQSGADGKAVRSFNFQKLAPGIYKVDLKESLADGEYGFFYGGHTGGGKVFDFGVSGGAIAAPVPVPIPVARPIEFQAATRTAERPPPTRPSAPALGTHTFQPVPN